MKLVITAIIYLQDLVRLVDLEIDGFAAELVRDGAIILHRDGVKDGGQACGVD